MVILGVHRYAVLVKFLMALWRQWETVAAGKETLSFFKLGAVRLNHLEELAENDSSRPYVDGFAIVFLHQDQFGGAIVASGYMTRQHAVLVASFLNRLD